jgi:hypothetical protein
MRCDVGTLPVGKTFFSKISVAIYKLADDTFYIFGRWWTVDERGAEISFSPGHCFNRIIEN